MRFRTASDLLNKISYKPGWTLTADVGWTSDYMTINVEAWLPNSSDAPRYLRRSLAGDEFEINLTLIDESDGPSFIRAVLDSLIAWEIHEAREFFRFGEGMIAPFHPHKPAGRDLWDQTNTAREAISVPIDRKYQLVGSDL